MDEKIYKVYQRLLAELNAVQPKAVETHREVALVQGGDGVWRVYNSFSNSSSSST